ncbi:MAG: hypothetical protein MUO76_02845 [Anaerolineaceae bacterium]|nr:hypothetical protein [Anaerolineaceae bacterium]
MQIDFHYYCIGILARAAGFSDKDAMTIAYASQYVDDATENKHISFTDQQGNFILKIDPVRTAYFGLKANDWSIHKRVFIPFHFIPPEPFDYIHPRSYLDPDDFVTMPGSPFGTILLRKAAQDDNPKRRLCRIGIALHTYADTWSHQGFSGRESEKENALGDIDIWEDGWIPDRFTDQTIEFFTTLIAEETGHGEAGLLPDISFLKWRFRKVLSSDSSERDNVEVFYKAAKSIYNELGAIVDQLKETDPSSFKDPIPWHEISHNLYQCFQDRGEIGDKFSFWDKLDMYTKKDGLEMRCQKWMDTFSKHFCTPTIYSAYDRTSWRNLALNPNLRDPDYNPAEVSWHSSVGDEMSAISPYEGVWSHEKWVQWENDFRYDYDFDNESLAWDNWSEKKFERQAKFILKPEFRDSLWVHFHRAALEQRNIVLEHLP